MKCPICKKDVDPAGEFFPFCSERCKIIDLGNWASEKYVISTPVNPSTEDDAPDSDPRPDPDPQPDSEPRP
jgi:endogenous inhibitor of DNA gyrase (YacG/DUF329 family)